MLLFLLMLASARPATTHVTFTNRTEVALVLTVDGNPMCGAASMETCEADIAYGPHHLAASFRGKELITRESPAKDKISFAVCHTSDTNPICKAKE